MVTPENAWTPMQQELLLLLFHSDGIRTQDLQIARQVRYNWTTKLSLLCKGLV